MQNINEGVFIHGFLVHPWRRLVRLEKMFSRLTAMDSPCWLVCSDGVLEQVKIKDVFLYKAFILLDDVIV